MPYIKKQDREAHEALVDLIKGSRIFTCGELNYLITNLCLQYIRNNGECYQSYNDITGALENLKMELYARKARNYEDKKIKENGDLDGF